MNFYSFNQFTSRPASYHIYIEPEKTLHFVDVELALLDELVVDPCDPTPFVELTVYSDEQDIGRKTASAYVSRRYDLYGRFVGWRVHVLPTFAKRCDGHWNLCERADGRVYTIRVCARNQAGLQTCRERGVLVPLPTVLLNLQKNLSRFDDAFITRFDQGKLYKLAADAAFLNQAPAFVE